MRLPLSPGVARRLLVTSSAVLLAWVQTARAQDTSAPAHVALIDGTATIERDGQAQPAAANMPFVPGDRLRTTAGRVEVIFADGTVLDADEYTSVDAQAPTLLRLTAGRVMLIVAGVPDPARAVSYQIDTPDGSIRTNGPGEYRVAIFSSETELAVFRGEASLSTDAGTMPVRAGQRSAARSNEAPSFPLPFNSARFDAFDRWSAERRDARVGAASTQYLPPDLRMYGSTFDRYGSWQYAAPYGYVWYPSVVPGWRPYYNGYWAPIRPYGWTWIGLDLWSWPTHHYGRWGFMRGSWFWIPARAWAPAWVAWGAAAGLVSWCPLGFDNRPVFASSVGNPWDAWVAVPRTSFGVPGHFVNRVALTPPQVRATPFMVQNMPPVAVPRFAHQASVVGRQSPAITRQSPTDGRWVTVPRAGALAPGVGMAVPRPGMVAPSVGIAVPRVGPTPPAESQPSAADSSQLLSRTGTAVPRVGREAPTSRPQVGPPFPRPMTDDPRPATAPPPIYRVPRAPEIAGPRYRAPVPVEAPNPPFLPQPGRTIVAPMAPAPAAPPVMAVPRIAPQAAPAPPPAAAAPAAPARAAPAHAAPPAASRSGTPHGEARSR